MRITLLALLALSSTSYSQEYEPASVYLTLGAFGEDSGTRSGAQLSATVLDKGGFGFHAGGMIYDSNPNTDNTGVFTGYFATGILHINGPIGPYMGIGVFTGDDKNCDPDSDDNPAFTDEDGCTHEYILSFFPEVGVSFTLGNVQVTPFGRRFFDTDNDLEPFNVYGINFSVGID